MASAAPPNSTLRPWGFVGCRSVLHALLSGHNFHNQVGVLSLPMIMKISP